ncbi:MAG: hypothetical protein LIO91_03605 [Bacteroidales bacterium]|nr:hypothetical protein [Bacteroidales bacterium]
MKLYLAGAIGMKPFLDKIDLRRFYMLESFLTIQPWQIPLIPQCAGFMLDSGAFSFIEGRKLSNLETYVQRYIDFVRTNNIRQYIELDLDPIIGVENARKLRSRLEAEIGWPSIPVWHLCRGKQAFLEMCDEYDYVAIGGVATGDSDRRKLMPILPWLIAEAHKRNAKIHGLGFTNLKELYTYRFDSVDSTTWTCGSRFGTIMALRRDAQGRVYLVQEYCVRNGKRHRAIDGGGIMEYNLMQWIKFQQYAESNL